MLKRLLKFIPLFAMIILAFLAGYEWRAHQQESKQKSTQEKNLAAAREFFDIDDGVTRK